MTVPWYALCLLFLVPFVDPRRPLRILHLDLLVLVLLGLEPLRWYLSYGRHPEGSGVVLLLGLGYLACRLLWLGFRPRRRPTPLVPVVPAVWLALAVAGLAALRTGWVLVKPEPVRDVGQASVIGADLIGRGRDVYGAPIALGYHSDTYGPAAYLLYVPFEQALPWGGGFGTPDYDDPDAARAAAITFDLLTVVALLLLGGRLRPGAEGRLLGVALAYAWLSNPYSLLVLRFGFNDALVALLVAIALLAVPYASGRGALTALATATKFVPAVLAPVLATGTGERRLRSLIVFTCVFAVVSLAVWLPLIPDGGLGELYDRTLGYQRSRPGRNSLWGEFPGLDWLRTPAQIGILALSGVLAILPRRRTGLQVAALGAAVLVAFELTITHWFSVYVLWFAPLAFVALFGVYDCRPRPTPTLSAWRALARWAPQRRALKRTRRRARRTA